jgi:hypothetical protein
MAGCSQGSADQGPAAGAEAERTLAGGYVPAPPADEDVVAAAAFAVAEIDKRANCVVPHRLERIVTAQKQVVAGVNYALELELSCGPATELHEVVVFSQPWTNTMRLTSDTIRQP